MSDPNPDDEAFRRERSRRNIALALALGAFVIIVFLVTVARLSENVPQ